MTDTVTNNIPDFDNMSDEDFLTMDWNELDTATEPTEGNTEEVSQEETSVVEPDVETYNEEQGSEAEGETEEEVNQEQTEEVVASGLIGKPLNINGVEYTFNSEEEILQLINNSVQSQTQLSQFSKYQKTISMLENNELMDEGKLSFAMDLLEGKPEAIRKLIADRQINIDDIDTDSELDYKPSDRSVSDKDIAWKQISSQLQATEEGRKAVDVVAHQWDEASKKAILEEPSNLLHLANQIKDGSYQKIMNEVSRRKLLGTIPANTNQLQAYAIVGKELLGGGEPQQQAVQETQQVNKRQVSQSRQRATPTRQTVTQPKKEPSIEDMASMSDEDFLKLF